MSYTLSEQDKSLLSAFHDGETSGPETAEARDLLARSPEARAWLRDAGSVRAMSVEAASLSLVGIGTSGKLTGAAIAAAAAKQGIVSGGGFFAAARSPLGLTGAAALLVVGAIFAIHTFSGNSAPPTLSQMRPAASVSGEASRNVSNVTTVAGEDASLMVPPITSRDLIGFALDGSLPINAERTQFVGMSGEGSQGTEMTRAIEARIATLDPSHIKSLDSLAKLLRSSIVRLQGNSCAVRSDLPNLRMSVIGKLEGAQLPENARAKLTAARIEAQANRRQISSSLDENIRTMEEHLLAAGKEPYVLIETNRIEEKPTGDRNYLSVLSLVGPNNRMITVDPDEIRISEPNPSIGVTLASVETPKKVSSRRNNVGTGTTASAGTANTPGVPAYESEELLQAATEPFMQSITINLFSGPGMNVIVSNDEMDTTWQSPVYVVRNEPQIIEIYSQLNILTDSLNVHVSRIAIDRSESPHVRARRIISAQQAFGQRLRLMLDSLEQKPNGADTPPQKQDTVSPAKSANKEAADNSAPTGQESTCLPWEDCTGIG